MKSRLHFISGLPRSGSTLLSAILRQNPRFHAEVTSPVLMLCAAMQEKMAAGGEFSSFFTDERRQAMLRGLFQSYYVEAAADIVFDTNRLWTGRAALLSALYPQARLICCVREVGWIIDSLERMLRKNPLQHSRIFGFKPGASIYARVETLMNSDTGLVGQPWACLREAWFGQEAAKLIVVQYETLAREPAQAIDRLYRELDEPPFQHDFEALSLETAAYDADLGMPGLHSVRSRVEPAASRVNIPPDIFAKYSDANFWKISALNGRGVVVI